ncbi:MAPEG family protein [Rhodoplanes sp. Z2-YC6860]|uniref:MAPEG family protein n=1 Tax=Rhodoplanes sp. Z2-YC6860 TaxID=674703 RepID=UPI00078CBD63|nr:MAPEG family protein [Rhodoplanes sp. Z2-YC6860]AMN44435.1 glutathione S-transferase [Rhodoplanes sp. Z2-YC6860]
MIPTIVPFYAAVLGLIFIFLSARVIVARRQFRIRLGSGGQEPLERRIRVQGNFAEYVPLTIILLTFLELYGAARWLIHALCIALILGRCLHAYCVSRTDEDIRQRRAAMGLTFGALAIAAIGVVFYSGQRLLG